MTIPFEEQRPELSPSISSGLPTREVDRNSGLRIDCDIPLISRTHQRQAQFSASILADGG